MFSLTIFAQPNAGDQYIVDTASSRYGMDPRGGCWGLIPGLHLPAAQDGEAS
jgi:hypothetical protein